MAKDRKDWDVIFKRAQAGDGGAWLEIETEWVESFTRVLSSRFLGVPRPEIRRCVNNVLLSIYARLGRFESVRQAWVYARKSLFFQLMPLPRVLSLDVLRVRGFEPEAHGESLTPLTDGAELLEAISRFEADLASEDREIVEAWIAGEPSVKDLARRLGWSPSSIKRRRHDLKLRLRAYLSNRHLGGGVTQAP